MSNKSISQSKIIILQKQRTSRSPKFDFGDGDVICFFKILFFTWVIELFDMASTWISKFQQLLWRRPLRPMGRRGLLHNNCWNLDIQVEAMSNNSITHVKNKILKKQITSPSPKSNFGERDVLCFCKIIILDWLIDLFDIAYFFQRTWKLEGPPCLNIPFDSTCEGWIHISYM